MYFKIKLTKHLEHVIPKYVANINKFNISLLKYDLKLEKR